MNLKSRAFTLIETIISLIIFSIIVFAIYNFMVSGNKQFLEGKNIAESIQNIRLIMEYLQHDMNRMKKLEVSSTGDNKNIKFTLKDNSSVTYTYNASTKLLSREEGGIFKNKIKWQGISSINIRPEIRAFDKTGKFFKKYPSDSSSQLNSFTIDLSAPHFPEAFEEFAGVKVKIVSSFHKQKKFVYLERYIFPQNSHHKVALQWVYQ